ncbi:flagellar brake protein [sulfur-oxidizing endosymbiont of Gigantopelta aegis]|uniref:flagellar brake protein n=1 Tax=sulfur-oxidizing endosymbiont of Gigantopelta aegis TaxID=2794934 RepID=UPI0018DB4ECB|nr:flagellar brake protein [sulfur-oxidizing endosymbiont of Gigantopelta aegis]
MSLFKQNFFPGNYLNSLLDSFKKKKKNIQRNTYDSEKSIIRILKQLQQHLVIMTANLADDKEVYNTAIIKIDYKNRLFYLDELIPASGNALFIKKKKIHLQTRLDGAILSMECTLKEVGKEQGISHYVMYFPDIIRSTQRRESYRVSIPLSQRIQVNMQTESGAFIAGFLNDISFSGIAIRLEHNQHFDLNVDETIPFLTIHLKETITCEMDIKRISNTQGSTIISGHLEELATEHRRYIQKFITRLDRKKRMQENN